jgi:hypothetical protein
MKVKHLIETLQKCDTEAELRGFWEGTSWNVNAITKRKDGHIYIHVDDLFYKEELQEGEEILLLNS